MRAITTASSAPATARNTTPQAAFGRDQRRPTWRCRPTNSSPIAKSRLAKLRIDIREFKPAASSTSSGSHHERTIRLPADPAGDEVDRTASADYGSRPLLVRGLSDAAQSELLVDLRRHPFDDARFAGPDRRDPGNALHAACRHGLQVGRADHAQRELWLAVALYARERRVDVLPCRLHSHVPRPVLWDVQGHAGNSVYSHLHHLSADDGDRLLGLCASLGPDGFLGRYRHHQPVLRDSLLRREHREPAVGLRFVL